MPPFKDITGEKFALLTAVRVIEKHRTRGFIWLWRCDCGNEIVYRGDCVKGGDKISCGCHRERKRTDIRTCILCGGTSIRKNEHGYINGVCHKCSYSRVTAWRRKNPGALLVISARARAKKLGLPCTITAADVRVPDVCPVLGIPLASGTVGKRENSPSIDRIIPELGYVKGNIAIISFRANRFKNDASPEELRAIADWIEKNRPLQEPA